MMKFAFDEAIARVIVRRLAPTGLSPNLVTTAVLALGIAAGLLLASGERWMMNLGAGLFMLAMLGDHIDGNLARATGKTSRFGHYYDHVAMATTYAAMFIGVGVGHSHGFLGVYALPLGVLAGISVAAIFSTRIGVEVKAGKDYVEQPRFLGFEPEDTLYVVGPITWLGWMPYFLIAAGIGTPLFLFYVIWQSRRQVAASRKQDEK
ncbi:MAG: CDP-alcohol phosphatidyltransferase family protein [Alphaproteobacteria bacterium]|nr:CDP-alcohol phosphatidyltransferase family protein [Alphaproteobacteria bacterium]